MIQVQTCDRTTTKHDGDFFLKISGDFGSEENNNLLLVVGSLNCMNHKEEAPLAT